MEFIMEEGIRVLLVAPVSVSDQIGETVEQHYGAYFPIEEIEAVPSLMKALNALNEEPFQLCLVSDRIPADGYSSFVNDLTQLADANKCPCLLFTGTGSEESETSGDQEKEPPLKPSGFHSVISLSAHPSDINLFRDALSRWYELLEQKKTKQDVEGAMKLILRNIDNAASNIKRGVNMKLNSLPSEFIEVRSSLDEVIYEDYLSKLEARTKTAEPENENVIEIPETILQKDLPKLEKNTYTGASTRVWRKLLKKHGKEERKDQ
jgi:hypothetical protein